MAGQSGSDRRRRRVWVVSAPAPRGESHHVVGAPLTPTLITSHCYIQSPHCDLLLILEKFLFPFFWLAIKTTQYPESLWHGQQEAENVTPFLWISRPDRICLKPGGWIWGIGREWFSCEPTF